MFSNHCVDAASLQAYFGELLSRWRERQCRPGDLLSGREGVVLVGAGKVGREFLSALNAAHVPVLAFADNNQARWGTAIAAVAVLAPGEAVRRFRRNAVFLLTIGRIGTGIAEIREQFSTLGAESVIHFSEAIQFVPEIWQQFFLSPGTFTEGDADNCAHAYRLFDDAQSKSAFVTHLRWRATLDPGMLPTPDYENQYFPSNVVAPRHCAQFVDVGAYTGDTLCALSRFAGRSLRSYHGFEPDPSNYRSLVSQAAAMAERHPGVRIVTKQVAIGAIDQVMSFAGDGSATAQIDHTGGLLVQCTTLDSHALDPTYLKIDVEGSEDAVLRGGWQTLRTWKPTVAIATYHHPRDLFELPLLLATIAPDYRFYLRSHGDAGVDLVCYAVREPAAA
jgi:FkbM family methyltransferase